MSIFDALNLLGGLSLFLFGMTLMGQALERRAGDGLKRLLGRITTNRLAGLMTGIGVTAIIQSSSATTVMVVGFVNSGLMTLRQSINVIMGANVGTTVTAWLLSLAGINSQNFLMSLLKPSSFTPVLAFIGIILFMSSKNSKKRDTGMILLGFATLMFGMETMSASVAGLKDVPAFSRLFLAFTNPVLGVIAGAVLTAVIQSSSASVGILQALASTGAITYGAVVPLIMGQNIGTCVTAVISSVGTNKNAKRAAMVHLGFNIIGTAVWLTVFCVLRAVLAPVILNESASLVGIAVCHSIFNVLCTILMFPLSGVLETLVCRIIPDTEEIEQTAILDERLLESAAVALEQCRKTLDKMAVTASKSLKQSLTSITDYDAAAADEIRHAEDETDHLEDVLGTYLIKLTSTRLHEDESVQATEYMKLIGDYERIADHAVNILESAEEMREKELSFSEQAVKEYKVISSAVAEILDLSYKAFSEKDLPAAHRTEALEQAIDNLKGELRNHHIQRLQKGECTVETGFIWSDLLTDLERVSDHCSNVSACVLDTLGHTLNLHEHIRAYRSANEAFEKECQAYKEKYSV